MFMCSVNVDYLTFMRYGKISMHDDIFKGNITPTRTGLYQINFKSNTIKFTFNSLCEKEALKY